MIAYRLTCIPTGKIYIGITRRPLDVRIAAHFNDAKRQAWPASRLLFSAMVRFQRSLWTVEIIGRADTYGGLLDLERQLIARYRANDPAIGYNRTAGGQGTVGCSTAKTPEQRAKVGDFHRGRKRPAETKEKLRTNALRRWRENPEQFPPMSDHRRDCAIARAYFSAPSLAEAGALFGIKAAAACHAVKRFQRQFRDWLEATDARYIGVPLPARLHPEWNRAMELSL